MKLFFRTLSALAMWIAFSEVACAAEYEVGPGKARKTLQEIAGILKPGDVVTVDGGATYPGGVTLSADGAVGLGVITVTGRRVGGKRPVLAGVAVKGGAVLRVLGSHYVIQGFDMTVGGDARATRCFLQCRG